jgi:predicted phage terminase large subunit-like protein
MNTLNIEQQYNNPKYVNMGKLAKYSNPVYAELFRRYLAQYSMAHFVSYTYPNYKAAWYHKVICSKLDDWVEGKIKRLMVFTPPRHGKSSLASERLPAYILGRRPQSNIIFASYGQELANRMSRKVRECMRSTKYLRVFPHTNVGGVRQRLYKGQNNERFAVQEWETAQGGGQRSVGIGAGTTGYGCHYGIIDDPHKDRASAESATLRQGTIDWYNTVFYTRLAPQARILIIQTRWHCLTEDNLIMTKSGLIKIKDLSNESVFCSNGFNQIKAKASRKHNGKILSIKTFGYPLNLTVTPEHKIYTDIGWLEAKKITKDHWVGLDIPKSDGSGTHICRSILNMNYPKSNIKSKTRINGKKCKISKKQLAFYLDKGMTYNEVATIVGYKHKSSIFDLAKLYGLNRPVNYVLDSKCSKDKDFWWVVGLWVAEGCTGSGGKGRNRNIVRFALHKKEIDYFLKVKNVLARYGLKITEKITKDNGRDFQCCSKQLAELMRCFGEGQHNRIIPEFVFNLGPQYIEQFIDGYWSGDGCISKGWYRIGSCSLQLLCGARLLLAMLSVPSAIMNSKEGSYELRYKKDNISSRTIRIKDGILFSKIKVIENKHYNGLVYDIQTESHDFCVGNARVHNCDDLCGTLLKKAKEDPFADKWEVISLPAILEEPSKNDYDIRKPGQVLWPEWFSAEYLQTVRANLGTYDWSALYQQRPLPAGGGKIKREWFKIVDEAPEGLKWSRFYDLAVSTRATADFTASLEAAMDEENNIYLRNMIRDRWEWPDVYKMIVQTARNERKTLVGVESNGPQRGFVDQLLRDPALKGIALKGYNMSVDKLTRALPWIAKAEAGKVYLIRGGWINEFLNECQLFTGHNDKHDDQIDAVSGCYIMAVSSGLRQRDSGTIY